jgi:hypothetical protein
MTTPTQNQWPTPTGDPAPKHRALELADRLDHCGDKRLHYDASDTIRRLHALVVQMLETVEACHSALVRIREAGGKSTSAEILCERDLLAATDYLKGQQ